MIHSVSQYSNIMELRTAFETLGEVVDHYEGKSCAVRNVETTAEGHGETLHAAFDLAVPFGIGSDDGTGPGFELEDATVTEDGVLSVSFSVSSLVALPSSLGSVASVTRTEVDVVDGEVVLALELVIGAAGESERDTEPNGAEPETTVESGLIGEVETTPESAGARGTFADVRDESVPAYEDTEYLRTLYEECDNFGEMSRSIEMDVSSETVRRYMIEAGIHQPDSYDTARIEDGRTTDSEPTGATGRDEDELGPNSDRDSDGLVVGEEIATDGIGLPDGVLIEDIADAVVSSATVHQVQRQLGLERTRTRELLEELNLLDLVLRPIADSDRTVSYDQVATRLRQCAPSGA